MQRQPRLRRIGRLRAHLQGLRGTARIEFAAAAEVVVEEAGGAAAAETRARQQQRAAALWHQQVVPLDHRVHAPVDLTAVLDVVADALQRRAGRRVQVQFARAQRHTEIQPHHHAHALLHVGPRVVDDGLHEDVGVAHLRGHVGIGGSRHRGTGRGHLQPQGRGAFVADLQRRNLQRAGAARRQHHAEQGLRRDRAVDDLHLPALDLVAEREIRAQRRVVRRGRRLVGLDVEGHALAGADVVAIQPRARGGSRRQRQQQRGQHHQHRAGTGPLAESLEVDHGSCSRCLRSCSSLNLARSRLPGSSGTRRSHASTA
ncbi:hypothetical protein NB705_003428 [Xanthomonas sacchari]|nr:hypothetical protein [Xanthomonas sacchari]